MNVWVDQDLCTGDGLCEELCPSVFQLVDGLSYVCDEHGPMLDGGSGSTAVVPVALLDAVIEAAAECPGECIFVEA